jgi:hypothetical protein
MEGAMRIVRVAAVVLAILGGTYALLGFAKVLRYEGGSDEAIGYVWLAATAALVFVGGSLAMLSQDGRARGRACPKCGERADEGWSVCPICGTGLRHAGHDAAGDPGGEQVKEALALQDYQPGVRLLAKALFWLGIAVLDILFVLLVLWLFVPSLALSPKIFSADGPLSIVLLDAGVVCVLVGYSLRRSG